MILGIDPKVDYAFKFLFGNEKNTQPLIHLLHSILNPTPEEQIVEVEILNLFNERMALDDKLSILDIRARDQLGRHFNVEMQMLATPGLRQRVLYYWAKLYAGQLQAGNDYRLLRPTISVCFLDGLVFPAVLGHHLEFHLIDATEGVALTDDLTIHLFELPKFRLAPAELATPLDAWLYFLCHAEGMDPEVLPGHLGAPAIRQAMEVLAVLTQTDIEKEIYEGRIKARRDYQMLLDAAANARAEALVEGRAEGRAEGLEKGALLGRVEVLQRLLQRDPTPRAELDALPPEALEALAAQLEREMAEGVAPQGAAPAAPRR
ncbi:MAG: PD-(D/E)XK nuclease family transposase [Armatimonadetes bacterium]|nr:PD-(D/E)XK nuclease family transposase [Armatimonadota bacterium]